MDVLIWGTGNHAKNFLGYVSVFNEINIIGFVESEKNKEDFAGKKVYSPQEVNGVCYDYLLIASTYVEDIKKQIHKYNVLTNTIIFLNEQIIPAKYTGGEYIELDLNNTKDYINWIYFPASGICTDSRDIVSCLTEYANTSAYWINKVQYNTNTVVPTTRKNQIQLLQDYFIPYLTKDSVVCDFGCASGEWSRFISPYVKQVEGFDISEKMVLTAQKQASENKISNIVFSCMDARQMEFQKMYNNIMMLGLLTYIEDDNECRSITKKVCQALLPGGRLALRDTLSISSYDKFYFYNQQDDGYLSIHRSTKIYEKLFEEAGFIIEERKYLNPYRRKPIELGSHGYILKKKDIPSDIF